MCDSIFLEKPLFFLDFGGVEDQKTKKTISIFGFWWYRRPENQKNHQYFWILVVSKTRKPKKPLFFLDFGGVEDQKTKKNHQYFLILVVSKTRKAFCRLCLSFYEFCGRGVLVQWRCACLVVRDRFFKHSSSSCYLSVGKLASVTVCLCSGGVLVQSSATDFLTTPLRQTTCLLASVLL